MNTALDSKKAIQQELGVLPDGKWGPKTDAAADALKHAPDASPWPPGVIVQPTDTINTIIDINHQNGCDIPKLKAAGICAVIHKATEGTNFKDSLYHSRRDALRAAGILTGAYHFNGSQDPAAQARFFIDFAKPDDKELIAFDWEQIPHNLTLAQAHVFVQTVFDLTGRYPMIYGSNVCREAVGDKPDALLARCKYWHVRYAPTPNGIPTQIWPTYDLWQFDDGTHVPTPGSDGADRNKFQGDEAALRAAWPFTRA